MNLTKTCMCFLVCSGVFTSLLGKQIPLTPEHVKSKASAKLNFNNGNVSLKFNNPGWNSGIKVIPAAKDKFFDLSKWKILAVDIENLNPKKQLRLTMHISAKDKQTGKKRKANTGIAVNPHEKRTMRMIIPHRSVYETPKGVPGIRIIDSDKISSIELYMQWPFEGKTEGLVNCNISNLRLEGLKTENKISEKDFFPFIDEYGQYIHKQWPQKIKSNDDLKKNHKQELKELASAKYPTSWNRYGGWKNGPSLKATGNFRVEKYKGKWYFVDPAGKLFISHGIDVLYAHTDATKTKNHHKWFKSKIPKSGALAFTDNNLKLKYGKKEYASDFYDVLVKRMKHWGFNTIGDWANSNLIKLKKIPYTLQLTDYNRKLPRISGSKLKFYDVFDHRYISAMKNSIPNAIKKTPIIKQSLTDPLCIGYFIDNELNYGNRESYHLIKDVLKSPKKQKMKQVFLKDLKSKYTTITNLNKSWKTKYKDWDKLLESTTVPKMNKALKKDASAFMRKSINQYFRLCRDAIKSVAPHRLYLGSRFISTDAVRKMLYEASKKYCDVLTVNVYAHSTANLKTKTFPDMPILIGEFHFGIFDRGMFAPGLCPAGVTQKDRALAYTRFIQGALVHPGIVGTHWFQFRDQPLTGRWDGEGYAIGFVDVADTPYKEMIEASRQIGENMYQYRMNGKLNNSMR